MKYFGGRRPPKYLTEPHPSNILGVYSPQMFDRTPSVKYLGVYTPKIFHECGPSNILGVYSPQIFDGTPSVKYFGGLDPQNI